MQIFKLLFLCLIINSCQNSSGVRRPATKDLQVREGYALLKTGIYQVEYYAGKEVAPEYKQILQKFSKILETNALTQKYFSQLEKGAKPEYNSNIGISKREYNHLVDIFSYKSPEKVNGTLTISRKENMFIFKGNGSLSLLDSVSVNVNSLSASFEQYNMSRAKVSIDLLNENVPKGDTLEDFEFYRGPTGILGLTVLPGTYELLIAKLIPSGKTYLSFFAKLPDKIEHPIPEYITVIFD